MLVTASKGTSVEEFQTKYKNFKIILISQIVFLTVLAVVIPVLFFYYYKHFTFLIIYYIILLLLVIINVVFSTYYSYKLVLFLQLEEQEAQLQEQQVTQQY